MTDQDVRFAYFTVKTNNGDGFVCMAVQRPPKNVVGAVDVGFSFYSPHEVKEFSKRLARNIALGRLRRGSGLGYTELQNVDTCKLHILCHAALVQAVKENCVPGWLLRAFKRGSVFSGLNPSKFVQVV